MALSKQLKNQHLLWRAGFGPAVEQLSDLSRYTPAQVYKALQKASSQKITYIDVADDFLQGLVMGVGEAANMARKELTEEERKMVRDKNREGVRNLNSYWLGEMVASPAQLREKMALFWHGHFACRNLNVFYQQGLLDILRRNALGNFGTMLAEVSRSAAMLNFLNNQQNRKGHPNENFAREVMELFTVGRGNYTEQDVKEAARAFTGWASNARGEFIFREGQHDKGEKTVLGTSGVLDGDDVLEILLKEKATASFLCRKLYMFFVNNKPDEAKIRLMADRFYNSGYDIGGLMEFVFTSDWFYEERNIGANIKSPVELLVGFQRMIPMNVRDQGSMMTLQRLLGQVLFYPPNVAGWPGGRSWIDSSTLMVRLRIPQLFTDQDELELTPKADDDQMMGRRSDGSANLPPKPAPKKQPGRGLKLINAKINWKPYQDHFQKTERSALVNAMAGVLLQTPRAVSEQVIRSAAEEDNREVFIRSVTTRIMGTPEYQLC